MNSPSMISPPHRTNTGEPLNDSVRHGDFLHAHRSNLSSRKQPVHSQKCQAFPCQYHSEPDLLSHASPPPFRHSFASATKVQCQKQRGGPSHPATPILPCHGLGTFSVDRRPSITHSATGPSWNCHCPEPLNGVTSSTHTATRGWPLPLLLLLTGLNELPFCPVLLPVTAGDQNVYPVMRYHPIPHNPFSDAISDAQPESHSSAMASVTVQEEFENEMCEWSADGTGVREHSRQVRVGNNWKGDANAKAVLMFVSPLQLTPVAITVLICSKDRHFYPNRRVIHHGNLQDVVLQSWRQDIASYLPSH